MFVLWPDSTHDLHPPSHDPFSSWADLCAIVNVVESGVLQRPADRFTIKFCGEALPLAGLLLASPSTRHHQAALRLVEEMLNSWGTFVSDVLR